jgi:hypothetical protein
MNNRIRPLVTGWSAAIGCMIAGVLLLQGARAHAQDDDARRRDRGRLMLALDFDYSSAWSSAQIEGGGGGAFRIGTQMNVPLITLIPELAFEYHTYGSKPPGDAQTTAGKIGGRIRFLEIIEPGIFAHIGIGHVGGNSLFSHTGFALDTGITLDLTIIPLVDFGLHASWNRIYGGYDGGTSYGIAGAHVALVL